MHAYCYASGQIEFGERIPDGALPIARGKRKPLQDFISGVARHAYDGETLPHFTRSIEAALTLVPHVEPRTHWHIQCYPHGCYSATVSDAYPVGTHYCGQHMTSPAIALCIACLRARP